MNDNGKAAEWEHLRQQSDLVQPDMMAILHLMLTASYTMSDDPPSYTQRKRIETHQTASLFLYTVKLSIHVIPCEAN